MKWLLIGAVCLLIYLNYLFFNKAYNAKFASVKEFIYLLISIASIFIAVLIITYNFFIKSL